MVNLKLEKQSVMILTIIGVLVSVGFAWNLLAQTGFQNWLNITLAFALAGLLVYEANMSYAIRQGGFRLALAYLAVILAIGAILIGFVSINYINQAVPGALINMVKTSGTWISGLGVVTFVMLAFRK